MINYLTGDATDPQVPGKKIIAHVNNDIGGWGRGFALSMTKRWPAAEQSYRRWYQEQGDAKWPPFSLGNTVFVPVTNDILVANMIGQHGILVAPDGGVPIRYDALEKCLTDVFDLAREFKEGDPQISVHMPRIGCGLAGGKWSEVEPIIIKTAGDIEVFVYDFDTKDARTVPWNK